MFWGSLFRRSNSTDVKGLQTLSCRLAGSRGVEHLRQHLQGQITSHPLRKDMVFQACQYVLKKWCQMWNKYIFVAAGGGEGTQWPSVPEAADLAGWASETGGRCGGLSCGGYWSQRNFFGLKTHRKTEKNAANCNWLKTLIKINFWSSTTL